MGARPVLLVAFGKARFKSRDTAGRACSVRQGKLFFQNTYATNLGHITSQYTAIHPASSSSALSSGFGFCQCYGLRTSAKPQQNHPDHHCQHHHNRHHHQHHHTRRHHRHYNSHTHPLTDVTSSPPPPPSSAPLPLPASSSLPQRQRAMVFMAVVRSTTPAELSTGSPGKANSISMARACTAQEMEIGLRDRNRSERSHSKHWILRKRLMWG